MMAKHTTAMDSTIMKVVQLNLPRGSAIKKIRLYCLMFVTLQKKFDILQPVLTIQ